MLTITTVKLQQYIVNFVDNVYDDINIAAEMMTHTKLIELDINKMEQCECSCCKLKRYNNLTRIFAGPSRQ